MSLPDELSSFAEEVLFLDSFKARVYAMDFSDEEQWQTAKFLAEALLFRLYRAQERLVRAIFLDTCVTHKSYRGISVTSRLSCPDWGSAEEIMKSSVAKFLDWGNPQQTTQRASIIFEGGFPITDTIGPLHSTLVDLQRIRNFIAHDSMEAETQFRKAASNYVSTGVVGLQSAGDLLLTRKRAREAYVLTKLMGWMLPPTAASQCARLALLEVSENERKHP
ncbi:MAG: hypothetical protein RIE32_14620 [Phycisphaerales bacterium]